MGFENKLEGLNLTEGESKQYEFFPKAENREKLFEYTQKLAEYLKSQQIADIILMDRAARPIANALKAYWQNQAEKPTEANIYFFNKNGFGDYGSDYEHSIPGRELKAAYPKLIADKDQPVLLFDTCVHSGDTLAPIAKQLRGMNFSDLRLGSISKPQKGSPLKTDFYIEEGEASLGCHPFGWDSIVERDSEHVFSKPNPDQAKRDYSIRLKREIAEIIKEYTQKQK